MKKCMMAILLLHCMQQPLQSVPFGDVEAAIVALLFVGIAKECDIFHASQSKKNMSIEQSKIFGEALVYSENPINFCGKAENENKFKKQNIVFKPISNRPLLKGSAILQNSWQPLKKIQYSSEK